MTVTFSGTLNGCSGLSGIAITLVDHASGTALGTVTTTTGGLFSGSVTLASAPASVDFTTTGVPRFADSSTTKTLAAGSNAVGTLTLAPATGYHCATQCAYPLKDTMQKVAYVSQGFAFTGTNPFAFTTGGWSDSNSSLSTSTGQFHLGICGNVNLGTAPDAGTLVCPTTTAATFTAKWTLTFNSGACTANLNSATISE